MHTIVSRSKCSLICTIRVFFLTEAEKAAQKAEEEKAKQLMPIKTKDLPPIKVPSREEQPISNGNSDLNSPTDSSDQDGSSDSGGHADKIDSNNVSDHNDSNDHANHKHMNGSAFEKAEFHNKMNKLEERHTISTVQTLQIPGGSEVRTVQTVELCKITTNGTQQATFQNQNHED